MPILRFFLDFRFILLLLLPVGFFYTGRILVEFFYQPQQGRFIFELGSIHFDWILHFLRDIMTLNWFKGVLVILVISQTVRVIWAGIHLFQKDPHKDLWIPENEDELDQLSDDYLGASFDTEIDRATFVKLQRKFVEKALKGVKAKRDQKTPKGFQRYFFRRGLFPVGAWVANFGFLVVLFGLGLRVFLGWEMNYYLVENEPRPISSDEEAVLVLNQLSPQFDNDNSIPTDYRASFSILENQNVKDAFEVSGSRPGKWGGYWVFLEYYRSTGEVTPVIDLVGSEQASPKRFKNVKINDSINADGITLEPLEFKTQSVGGSDVVDLLVKTGPNSSDEHLISLNERGEDGAGQFYKLETGHEIRLQSLSPVYEAKIRVLYDHFYLVLAVGALLTFIGLALTIGNFDEHYWILWKRGHIYFVGHCDHTVSFEYHFKKRMMDLLGSLEDADPTTQFEYFRGGKVVEYG